MTEHSPADRRLPVVLVALACGVALIVAGQSLRTPDPAPVTPTPAPSVSASAPSPQVETGEPGRDAAEEPVRLDERLYAVGELAATDCADPRVSRIDADGLAAFAEQAIDECLMPAWSPALERVGVHLQRPHHEVVSADSITTDCGEMSNANQVVAFYCTQDRTIYLFTSGTSTYAERAGWLPMAVLAHEFGHHVQNATDSWPITDDEATDRRIELQAECLAGVWFHDGQQAIDGFSRALVVGRYVSNDTHGSAAVRTAWFDRGFDRGDTDDCRSYTADTGEVG